MAKVQRWQKLVSMSLVPLTRLSIHPTNFQTYSAVEHAVPGVLERTYIRTHTHRGREQNETRNSPKLRDIQRQTLQLDIPAEPRINTQWCSRGKNGQQT